MVDCRRPPAKAKSAQAPRKLPALPHPPNRPGHRHGQAPLDCIEERQLAVEPEHGIEDVKSRGEKPGDDLPPPGCFALPLGSQPRDEENEESRPDTRGEDGHPHHAVEGVDPQGREELQNSDIERIAGRMRVVGSEIILLYPKSELDRVVIPHPPRGEGNADKNGGDAGRESGPAQASHGAHRGFRRRERFLQGERS